MICPLSPMSSVSQYMSLFEKTDGPLIRKKGGQQGTGDKGERNMSELGFTIRDDNCHHRPAQSPQCSLLAG